MLEKASRRRFDADYKQRILAESEACIEPGEIGKLLRREGLYSSHLSKWRAQHDQTVRARLSKPKGRKPPETGLLAVENARLQKENQRLQGQLAQALTILDVQKNLAHLLKLGRNTDRRTDKLMNGVAELGRETGIQAACAALQVKRASFYRAQAPHTDRAVSGPAHPPLALCDDEERRILEILHSTRFTDCSPYQVYAALLDEGEYRCSVRTLYRILAAHGELRERRNQLRRPNYAKPELLATAPNRVWSGRTSPNSSARPRADVFLPRCHPRHLQPLPGRLDDRTPRGHRSRHAFDR